MVWTSAYTTVPFPPSLKYIAFPLESCMKWLCSIHSNSCFTLTKPQYAWSWELLWVPTAWKLADCWTEIMLYSSSGGCRDVLGQLQWQGKPDCTDLNLEETESHPMNTCFALSHTMFHPSVGCDFKIISPQRWSMQRFRKRKSFLCGGPCNPRNILPGARVTARCKPVYTTYLSEKQFSSIQSHVPVSLYFEAVNYPEIGKRNRNGNCTTTQWRDKLYVWK